MTFYRCKGECGRKWSAISLDHERAKPCADLVEAARRHSDTCPSCGGALVEERGTFSTHSAA